MKSRQRVKRKRSGFSAWICSDFILSGDDPFSDLGRDWKYDINSPDHANTWDEIDSYLRRAHACWQAVETAEEAFAAYSNSRKRSVSPKLRFEVLERDGFTCRYCGRSAPEFQIVVDHVVPFSKGGECAINNLVSACVECNTGKADRVMRPL